MKRFTKSVVVVFFVVLVSSPVFSGNLKFGIGASATSSSSTIYFPIKTDKFIIEPMVRYRQLEYDSESSTMSRYREADQISIGSGFYLYSGILEKTDLIYGFRLGYMQSQEKDKQVQGVNVATRDQKLTGFFLAPTAGIEYNFNNHVTIGCNISLEYQKLSGDEKLNQGTEINFDTENEDFTTETNLFIKYYF